VKTVLVVDDDAAIARGVQEILSAENLKVLVANTGHRGYSLARQEHIDLIILDLKLPDISGEDICRDLRKEGVDTPILMLTSKKKEVDQVVGLEIGADDYMTKPFSTSILVARVRALLRRKGAIARKVTEYSFGKVYLDFQKQEATKGGAPVKLSSREFDVMQYLIQHEGEVVTREMLLNEVWGYEQFPTTRTVDNYILSLRRKLEDSPSEPGHLLTVHTSGYKFIKGT
jgi:DNA-binding response OmpR family regulator